MASPHQLCVASTNCLAVLSRALGTLLIRQHQTAMNNMIPTLHVVHIPNPCCRDAHYLVHVSVGPQSSAGV
eukprot:3218096-Amphidinium_carterae.1